LTEHWFQHWAGRLSILSSTYFGKIYTWKTEKYAQTRVKRSIIVTNNGFAVCNMVTLELKEFGETLAKRADTEGETWCSDLKKETDRIIRFLDTNGSKIISYEEFKEYLTYLDSYSFPHFVVKKVVDYLNPKQLEKLLPMFEEARIYSEKAYEKTEQYTRDLAKLVGKKIGLEQELVLCFSEIEFEEYLKTGELPKKEILEERKKLTILNFEDGNYELLTGKEAKNFEKEHLSEEESDEVQGMSAYPGNVTGTARIILTPEKEHEFDEGDIIVSGMTRPDYIRFIKKAAAVVTDAGGVLSHAAITARELKKPTIIGTLKATKIFQDGDLIEVDATNGTVRKKC